VALEDEEDLRAKLLRNKKFSGFVGLAISLFCLILLVIIFVSLPNDEKCDIVSDVDGCTNQKLVKC